MTDFIVLGAVGFLFVLSSLCIVRLAKKNRKGSCRFRNDYFGCTEKGKCESCRNRT